MTAGAYGPVRRKEDARFIRGRGLFVDDLQLPGMLHGAMLRSPLAHARILSVDIASALAHPKVEAVITGESLAASGLAWMPTLSGDVQAVLATDKVRYQGQEVAFVVAQDRYSALDALELINVDYEPLPPMIDAQRALDPGAPVVRDDLPGKTDNHIFDWEAGDEAATAAVFARADVVVTQDMLYPRSHPAPLETCGMVADVEAVSGKLTLCNKVPVYPGYLCAIVGSMQTRWPVKWMEDRSENLMSTSVARDYHLHGEIAASADGRILGLRARVLGDHGAFNATAQPTKYPAGFFHIFTGSYDIEAAHCRVTAVHTNKAPGGVAYACSFRITEAVYLVERTVDLLARELRMDPAELRMKNLLRPEQFPYTGPTGWQYDSGNYPPALTLAMEMAGYAGLRREQAEKRERGEYMGIGLSFFAEGVGAGPRAHMDIVGLGMADGADLRVYPTGKAVLAISVQTQGQGHETTFAQLVAHELGISPDDVDVVHGDTDRTGTAWQVRGNPEQSAGLAQIAMAAHGSLELPEGVEGHLDAETVYNPPNLTFPVGAYICVTDVDPGTGVVKARRFIAFDTDGNCLGGSFMDYLLPTALECPSWELGATVTPSPHHPIGAKGIGESATVGSPAAVVNSVLDALAPFGVRHADMPLTPANVWSAIQGRPLRTDLAVS